MTPSAHRSHTRWQGRSSSTSAYSTSRNSTDLWLWHACITLKDFFSQHQESPWSEKRSDFENRILSRGCSCHETQKSWRERERDGYERVEGTWEWNFENSPKKFFFAEIILIVFLCVKSLNFTHSLVWKKDENRTNDDEKISAVPSYLRDVSEIALSAL